MLIALTKDRAELILALVHSSCESNYLELKDDPKALSVSIEELAQAEDDLLVAIGTNFPTLYERYRHLYEARSIDPAEFDVDGAVCFDCDCCPSATIHPDRGNSCG